MYRAEVAGPPPEPMILAAEAVRMRDAARLEGLREGERAIRQELAGLFDHCRQIAGSLKESQKEMAGEWEGLAIKVVIRIAEAVVRRELRCDRDAVVRLTRAALQEVTNGSPAQVRVNPSDLELIQKALGKGAAVQDNTLQIIADETIELGGSVVWWGERGWDSQPSHQLKQIGELVDRWSQEDDGHQEA